MIEYLKTIKSNKQVHHTCKTGAVINQYIISKNYNKNTFPFITIYKIPCNINEHFFVSRFFCFKGPSPNISAFPIGTYGLPLL